MLILCMLNLHNRCCLYLQHNTMQTMYETIYKALQEVGLQNTYEPQGYLIFLCLGNCEVLKNRITTVAKSLKPSTPQELTQKSQRFMIYVHSKGMIVDDEYVILGSTNINQRSLEGTRDTEIAMVHISLIIHGQTNTLRETDKSIW
ncbi:hypothetical protein P3S67_010233 [Capsicum chacoense]